MTILEKNSCLSKIIFIIFFNSFLCKIKLRYILNVFLVIVNQSADNSIGISSIFYKNYYTKSFIFWAMQVSRLALQFLLTLCLVFQHQCLDLHTNIYSCDTGWYRNFHTRHILVRKHQETPLLLVSVYYVIFWKHSKANINLLTQTHISNLVFLHPITFFD